MNRYSNHTKFGRVAVALALSLLVSACGSTRSASKTDARERYLQALDMRAAGDARGYYDSLLALATEQPDTRAGRRARATLQSSDLMVLVALAGAGAAVAIPNFMEYRAKSEQSEAPMRLRQLAMAAEAFKVNHQRYCTTVTECSFDPLGGTSYVYFLTPDESLGGDAADDAARVRLQASISFGRLGIAPRMAADGFLFVAVRNLDSDDDLDIWTIDESGQINQAVDDLK